MTYVYLLTATNVTAGILADVLPEESIDMTGSREEYVITFEDTELVTVFRIEDNGGLCAEGNQMENLAQVRPGDNVCQFVSQREVGTVIFAG